MTSFVTSHTHTHTHNLALSNSLEFAVKTLPFCNPVLLSAVADDIPFDKSVGKVCCWKSFPTQETIRTFSFRCCQRVDVELSVSDNVLEILKKDAGSFQFARD